MRNALIKTIIIIALIFFQSVTGFCEVKLIKSGMMKDGGSLCVEYEKNGQKIICCIDRRAKDATNNVFIGGYPGSKDARIAETQEMQAVYDDIVEIMKSDEYKKYSTATLDGFQPLSEKRAEVYKMMSYHSLAKFKDTLFTRLLWRDYSVWFILFVVLIATYIYLRIRMRKKLVGRR